jgi:hypothetical protein
MHTFTRHVAVFAVLVAAVLVPAMPAAAADFSGPYRLQNISNGLCADVDNASVDNRARVKQWPCYSGAPQSWRMTFVRSDGPTRFYRLTNIKSGKCLDLPGGDPAYPLEQFDCWNGDMQLWAPELYPDGQGHRLRNLMANYQCLSVDPTAGAGASLRVRWCEPVQTQRWWILDA